MLKEKNLKTNEASLDGLLKPNNGVDSLRKQFALEILESIPDIIRNIVREKTADIKENSRIEGKYIEKTYKTLIEKYSILPQSSADNQRSLIQRLAKDLLGGVPLWRSPNLQYNVGAAVNRVSSALYSIALDLNIFNINDGLSGNTIIAEQTVTRILSELAGVDHKHSCGFFTFGGTATNLYAIKLGLAKAFPDSRRHGLPSGIKIAITEDSHFSHLNALNWLGVGADNGLVIKAMKDRTSDIADAAEKLRSAIRDGKKIPAIIINGGTTYDNAVDDIDAFVKLRDELVKEFNLDYVPQVHVDSVIGWAWLMFKDYDFESNPLSIDARTLGLIKMQYQKISKIYLADSWGVDFHKGVGSCPIPCSVIMINNAATAALLSYNEKIDTHQLAREFSEFSPVDYTLETSRPAGAALAALGAFNALGADGFRAHLANLVQQNQLFREKLAQYQRNDIVVLNHESLGYVTMVRIYPPDIAHDKDSEFSEERNASAYTAKVNAYMRSFYEFDLKDRMQNCDGVEYSYSSKYITAPSGAKIGALKFYPTSPYISSEDSIDAVNRLLKQKDKFDQLKH